jgi:hypothetical protein
MCRLSARREPQVSHNFSLLRRSGRAPPPSPLCRVYHRAMPNPKPDDVDFQEETTDRLVADLHNFYKVEKWTRDSLRVEPSPA